jgi:hypothetical protein
MPTTGHLEDYIDSLPEEMAPDMANDMLLIRKDSDGSMEKVTPDTLLTGISGTGWKYPADGRLTLESGVPVSVSDQTTKTTLYYTPFIGSDIALYNGGWSIIPFAEISIAVPNTASQMYDVFCYDNAGTATLELLAWTNDTTRATDLARQDGVLVKNGDATRRYLGSMRTTAVSGKTEDSLTSRFVWNNYNQVMRNLFREDATAHNFNAISARPWNNDATICVKLIVGIASAFSANFNFRVKVSGTPDHWWGIGIDSTSSGTGTLAKNYYTNYVTIPANAVTNLAIGYHYVLPLEFSSGNTNYGEVVDMFASFMN